MQIGNVSAPVGDMQTISNVTTYPKIKSVDYIVNDLKNMGMDHICDVDASVKIGKAIDGFLNGNNDDEGKPTTKRIISLKSKNELSARSLGEEVREWLK